MYLLLFQIVYLDLDTTVSWHIWVNFEFHLIHATPGQVSTVFVNQNMVDLIKIKK